MKNEVRLPTFVETVLHPFVERRTYLALLYSLLGLPLGVFYFCFVVTGLSLGLGLLVTLAGIPVLALTLAGCRGLAQLERTLAGSLLGASMPYLRSEEEEGSLVRRLARRLRSGTTWRELSFLLVRFATGVASFSIAVTVVAGGISNGLVQPILVAFVPSAGADFGSWSADTVSETLLFVPPALVLLLLAPAIINAQGRLERALAVAFLAPRIPRAEFRRAIARSLNRGETDAFGLMTDLELYFGPGPHLTPTKLEAHLLALEDLGLISMRRTNSRGRYSLTVAGRTALERA